MSLIALEEHFIPAEVFEQVWPSPSAPEELRAALKDLDGQRLRAMDAAGVAIQVLSVAAPGAQETPAAASLALARAVNDRAAATVAAHPDRFRALAALPTPDPDAAITELNRAVTELGFCGVVINGHTGGRFLDAPEFEPLLGAIEALDVPIYLHPTPPPPAVMRAYFGDLEPAIGTALATAAWGWHAETGMHVLRLAATGVFDRHPGLRVVVGHMGENLPFSLARADQRLNMARPGQRPIADIVLEHVHLTMCGYTTVAPLQCALSVFGADRILFSADYPFGNPTEHAEFLAGAPISPADRDKIGHGNARRLFRL
ncbi:MAG TPA: amidohydrolase family protein [Pseudonocardia sp.]|jgi:hypothetical protein